MASHVWESETEVVAEVDARAATTLWMSAGRSVSYAVHHSRRPLLHLDNRILAENVPKSDSLFVIDRRVDEIHGAPLREYLAAHFEVAPSLLILEATEATKSLRAVEEVCSAAVDAGVSRSGAFVAIGGGVLMDVVGLAASIYRRGIRYVRIPTTLVGQVDVAVGIKHGVNFLGRKNLLGTFYPPSASINDPGFLATLGESQLLQGVAEIVKIALMYDAGLFELVESDGLRLLQSRFQNPSTSRDAVILRSQELMAEALQPNLFETNLQRLVDFGHTFSPAIEMQSGYCIPHGCAVAVDMILSTCIAFQRGICRQEDVDRISRLYSELKLPLTQNACSSLDLWRSLDEIRSHRGGQLNHAVPAAIGRGTFLQDVSHDDIRLAIDYCEAQAAQAHVA